ncbi:MAG: flagellar export protein FliJ [Oscillospiraceae bacterium]|jgi:flagellar FliJ protein|nr:flagellar export protein FliJ [Oscillospiraceae bacterium]
MKKFVFTLQALHNYKLTVERLQKAELKRAQQALQELRDQEQRLINAWADNERSQEEALQKGENIVTALSEHDAYFRYLRDALIEVRALIVEAEEIVRQCQERLIVTMKEIKTYMKLRDEQYAEYQKEVQAEEAKEIDDLVSFNVISENIGA